MSRIGNKVIDIPKEVFVIAENNIVTVRGKIGELSQDTKGEVDLEIENDILSIKSISGSKNMHGLYRSLINNMIIGVSEGFSKELELVGVGYRASNQGQKLDLALGFSHNIVLDIAPEVKVETISEKGKNPIIKLTSHDKQLLGQVAAKIRSFRKPEPYKGKGIKFVGEILRRKAGKSA